MKRILFLSACLCAIQSFGAETNMTASTIPVVALERTIKSETDTETVWIDKMTDGTYRESVVKKQPTVLRTRLIATNDVGFAYRFDYESKLSNGDVVTNAAFRQKPQKEQLNQKLQDMASKNQPPMPSTNVVERIEKVTPKLKTQAAVAMAQAITVKKRLDNQRPVSSMKRGNGKIVFTYKDGKTEVKDLQCMVSARRPSPYEKKEVPKPTGKSATFLLGFAAGVAAMGGAVAVKKGKG